MSNVFSLQFTVIGVKNGFGGLQENRAGDGYFMTNLARLMPTNLVKLERRDDTQRPIQSAFILLHAHVYKCSHCCPDKQINALRILYMYIRYECTYL